jgi:hypothetical protein
MHWIGPSQKAAATDTLEMRLWVAADQRRIVAELDALQAEVDALKRLQAETACGSNRRRRMRKTNSV